MTCIRFVGYLMKSLDYLLKSCTEHRFLILSGVQVKVLVCTMYSPHLY